MRMIVSCATVLGVLCFAVVFAHGQELVIDDFDYSDASAAGSVWTAQEISPPIQIERTEERAALKLPCNFSTNDRRVAYDRQVELDLSRWTRFSIEVRCPNPTAASQFTIYFRSGDGWYGQGFSVRSTDWETVELSRAEFRSEDTPAGWHAISGIRIAVWSGAKVDAFALVGSLTAHQDSIVLLTDPLAGSPEGEGRVILQYATAMADMLRQAGVRTGAINEEVLLSEPLLDFDVIVLPYNPNLSEQAANRLAEYTRAGGKVLAFYALSSALGEALGVRDTVFVPQEYAGQFARIALDSDLVTGMPQSAIQSSWNIRGVEPVGHGALVIGNWVDADGKDTGYPALVLSDTGAYMSHVLIPEDVSTKTRMLVALLGHFQPKVWEIAGRAAVTMPAQMGHVVGQDVLEWLQDARPSSEAGAAAPEVVREIRDLIRETQEAVDTADWITAIEHAAQRDEKLRQAYALALKPRPGEFRAVWEHSGTGAYPHDWDKTMRVLAETGFNAIMPNSFWGGSALYQSELLPVSPVVAEKGDQIGAAVEAGRRYGIEVHPWKVCFRLDRDCPESFIEQMRTQGRLQVSISGEEGHWLCPSHPDNQKLEVDTMVEVATRYDVAGVHFDYIRYPDSAHCYCPGCRTRFQEASGLQVANWPEDLTSDELRDRWLQWRADQITHIVRETGQRVHAARPDCRVSAAVFSNYPGCYQSIGQDWVTWAREGYVDFLCPMNYTESDFSFAAWSSRQLSLVQGAVPLYPGIGATSSSSTLPYDRVAGQISVARNLGTDGFIVFNYTQSLGDTILPGLAVGIISEPTYVPHHGPRFEFSIDAEQMAQLPGVRLQPGDDLTCRIALSEQQRGPAIAKFSGTVVLETMDGQLVRQLGTIDSTTPRLSVQLTPATGAHMVAVHGQAEFRDGKTSSFTARSVPIYVGDLSAEIAALLGTQ